MLIHAKKYCFFLLQITLILAVFACSTFAGRIPKVYNAVVTTDQNLKSSKAYPLIQPVLHEQYAYYPYGPFDSFPLYPPYSPFSPYPPVVFKPPPPKKDQESDEVTFQKIREFHLYIFFLLGRIK